MRRRVAVLSAGIAAILVVAGVAGVAAQTGGSSPNPVGSFIERLAANLGIGEEELQAAIDKTHDEMIDDAVARGRLSPESAGALKERNFGEGFGRFERFEFQFGREQGFKGDGERVMPFGRVFPDGPGGHGPLSMVLAPVAEAIGIDEATLLEGLMNGKSLGQIAEEHGVTRDQLKQRLTATFQGHLDELLDQRLPFQLEREWRWPTPTPSGSNSSTFRGPGA